MGHRKPPTITFSPSPSPPPSPILKPTTTHNPPPPTWTTLKHLFTTLTTLNPFSGLTFPLSHPLWHLLETTLYALPHPPPPRHRPASRPMRVLCVGLPRTGTESLQQALMALGYEHTYHGWDVVYDAEVGCGYAPGWVALARRKWYGLRGRGEGEGYGKGGGVGVCVNGNGNGGGRQGTESGGDAGRPLITAADFDALLGHSAAVTDAAASVFAAELIAAYPSALVVLNMRRDTGAWEASLRNTLVHANESWGFWIASWLDRECFWAWHVYERFLWPLLFRAPDGDMARAIRGNARWVQDEHCNMIRGLVPKERLLEWYIEDGWEPLCKFLGKPVPDMEFPHANAANGGWKAREEQCNKRWVERAFVNLILLVTALVVSTVVAWVYLL